MGIADQMGWSNPFTQFVGNNRNTLMGFGAGLASGPTFGRGVAAGLQGAQQGSIADTVFAQQEEEKAKEAEMRKRYAELVSSWGADYEPFAAGIADGAFEPGEGYMQALDYRRETSQSQQELERARANAQFITDPQLRGMVEAGALPFSEAYKYQTQGGGEPPQVEMRYNQETGREEKVQWDPASGGWVPFGGTKAAPGTTGDLSAVETRELFETEDNIQSANNVISALDTALDLNTKSASGWGAEQFAGVGANLPDWVPGLGGNETRDANTLQLKNIVTEQALSQLKLVFGAAPTEGERQILLEIQGSVNQPQEVRKRIFERAKELALIRLQFNEGKKQRIEQGSYGAVQQPGAAPSGGQITATNPATGETVAWDGQQWVPTQ